MPLIQLMRVFAHHNKVINIAAVILAPKTVLNIPVKHIKVNITEKLAREISDRQTFIRSLVPQALVRRKLFEFPLRRFNPHIQTRVVKNNLPRKLQNPLLTHATLNLIHKNIFVYAYEKIFQVSLEIIRCFSIILCNLSREFRNTKSCF
jgi:hypothetical protein